MIGGVHGLTDASGENAGCPCLPEGLIPVEHWKAPETSVRRSLKDTFHHVLEQIRAGVSQEEQPFESLGDLPELSSSRLQALAPQPDFLAMARTLADCLSAASTNGAACRDVSFVVAPPFSGIRQALERFPDLIPEPGSASGSWSLIVPPDNLLVGEEGAREWWDRQDLSGPWVIPELADFWLRHLSGLALIRELLRRVATGTTGPGIVGCSSWCWQFWCSYLPDVHVAPLTPVPMDADHLGTWFQGLAMAGSRHPVVARMVDNGLYVLPVSDTENAKRRKYSGFLKDLASAARGNPGVALAIWQRSLRARSEEEAVEGEPGQVLADEAGVAPMWVVPFDQLGLPAVPQIPGDSVGQVLHALLLHDDLDTESLGLVTGIDEHDLNFVLSRLARSELIDQQVSGPRWHITAAGYPSVRRHLQSWGFPVDTF